MVTREDLDFIREYHRKTTAMRNQMKRLREMAGVHSVQMDSVRGGPERDRMAEHAARIDDLERKYNDLLNEYYEKSLRIIDEISALPPVEMEVIRLRYQEDHSWRWIIRQMHYSDRMVYRYHELALQHLGAEKTAG